MIATVKVTFVDAPKGRTEKRYLAGDVVSMSAEDFERITGQNKDLLVEGKHKIGNGVCHPCQKATKRSNKNTNSKK